MLRALLTIGSLQVLSMLVLLGRTKILALALGPELVGIMAVIDRLVAVFAQTASFSLPFAALRFLPPLWSGNPPGFDRTLRGMRNLLGGLVALATTVGLGVSLLRPDLWGAELLAHQPAVALAFVALPVVAFVPFVQNVHAARFHHRRAMLVALGHALTMLLGATLGVWLGDLAGFYAVYALAGVLLIRGAWHALRTERNTAAATASPPGHLPPLVWRFGAAMLVVAFLAPYAAFFVYRQVLVAEGAEAAGWMQAAIGIAIAVRTVLGASHGMLLTPNVNRGGTPAERIAWAHTYQQVMFLVAGVSVPVLMLFPDVAVRALYSSAFAPAALFVAIFVGAELVGLLAGTYQAIIVAYDHLGFHVAQNVVAQGVMILAAATLVPTLGILGAGIAMFASYVVLLVGTLGFLWHRYRLQLPLRLIGLGVFSGMAIAAAAIMGNRLTGFGADVLVWKAGLFIALVAGLILFLTPEQRGRLLRRASA